MNNVLELKGKRFVQASKNINGGGPSMNSKVVVTGRQIQRLIDKLQQIYEFWRKENRPFDGILISVHYNKIVAKTNRISGIFRGEDSNKAIVGAKFNQEKTKHIITYFLSMDELISSINMLYRVNEVMSAFFENGITKTVFDNNFVMDRIAFKRYSLSKSLFKQIVADLSYIEDFEVEKATQQFKVLKASPLRTEKVIR